MFLRLGQHLRNIKNHLRRNGDITSSYEVTKGVHTVEKKSGGTAGATPYLWPMAIGQAFTSPVIECHPLKTTYCSSVESERSKLPADFLR